MIRPELPDTLEENSMSSVTSARRTILVALFGFVCALLCVAVPAGAKSSAFGQADAAWHQGELEKAQQLYQKALAVGGLEPQDVVIAYSRVGTVKAAMHDKNGALSAFRIAAAIDPKFELPADSGRVAKRLYAQARKEAARQGERLSLHVAVPDSVPANQPFTVETTIPSGFAVLVAKVEVTIEDPLTKKKWRKSKPAEAALSFQFPSRVAIPGAHLKVHSRAVDSQNNAWAAADNVLKVEGTRKINSMDEGQVSPFDESGHKKDKKGKGGGLFKGPVPWIVGGALVVGGIVVGAVLATQSSSKVTVGSPTWQ